MKTAVILRSDRFLAEALRQLVVRVLPETDVRVAGSAHDAIILLATGEVDLLVTGLEAQGQGDVLELISTHRWKQARLRMVVITAHEEGRVLATLQALHVQGVFDSTTEDPALFETTLRTVARGGTYCSRSVLDQVTRYRAAEDSPEKTLTTTEQLVLSALGDGSDDEDGAARLGLSASTIGTMRRNIHRKLHVRHRGELMRVAAQYGFVRFTPHGVVRPGYTLLVAAYEAQRRKRPRAA